MRMAITPLGLPGRGRGPEKGRNLARALAEPMAKRAAVRKVRRYLENPLAQGA